MSRSSKKSHSSSKEDPASMPAMADLQIAPIRSSSSAYHDGSRRDYSASTILPPLRTLDSHARYSTSARPAALEPPRDPQPSSFSADTFQQSRRHAKSSRHQQPTSKHRPRTGDSTSSSSSVPSTVTSPRHAFMDPSRQQQLYEEDAREEEAPMSTELAWRERQPMASSPYSPEHLAYPTPVRSIAGCSDLSSEPQTSPISLFQSPSSAVSRSASMSPWRLRICQQPCAARACGFGERDRRVIDPPPIVQLDVVDSRERSLDVSEFRNTFTVVHVSLWDETGTTDCTSLVQPGRRPGGRLMGTLVASATVAMDEHDEEGVFYAFPDLSCRSYGNYRLRFALMAIDPLAGHMGSSAPVVAHAMSDVFQVYSAKDFPGMRPSTALTQAFNRQGIAIPVKKGKQQSRGGRDDAGDDDDEDMDEAPEPREEPKREERRRRHG